MALRKVSCIVEGGPASGNRRSRSPPSIALVPWETMLFRNRLTKFEILFWFLGGEGAQKRHAPSLLIQKIWSLYFQTKISNLVNFLLKKDSSPKELTQAWRAWALLRIAFWKYGLRDTHVTYMCVCARAYAMTCSSHTNTRIFSQLSSANYI